MKNVLFPNSVEFDFFIHNNCDKCAKYSHCRYNACDVVVKLVQGRDLNDREAKEYFGGPVDTNSKCLKFEPAENYIYRDILSVRYKGYSDELKDWVKGFLLLTEDGAFIINTDIIWLQEHEYPGLEKRFKVRSDSLGQASNFLDKNGVELFAGDIVELDYYGEVEYFPNDDPVEVKGEYMIDVVYPHGVQFVSLKKTNGYRDLIEARFLPRSAVKFKGNIYENKLKGKDNG